MNESEVISLEDAYTMDQWWRCVVKAVRGDMSAAVGVIKARRVKVVNINWSCVVLFSDEGDNGGLESGELDRQWSRCR